MKPRADHKPDLERIYFRDEPQRVSLRYSECWNLTDSTIDDLQTDARLICSSCFHSEIVDLADIINRRELIIKAVTNMGMDFDKIGELGEKK